MMLRSFLTVYITTMMASTVSAIELPNMNFGLRNFHEMVHVENQPEEITCNPTGNGPSTQDCPTDQLDKYGNVIDYACHLPTGECPDPGNDQSGVCTQISNRCNRSWRPVCGCDGETYSNWSCTRGINIRYEKGCDEEE